MALRFTFFRKTKILKFGPRGGYVPLKNILAFRCVGEDLHLHLLDGQILLLGHMDTTSWSELDDIVKKHF